MRGNLMVKVVFMCMVLMSCSEKKKIAASVSEELKLHPQAHLVDLYKYFFQDVFGPGHLISGREGPGKYLDQELEMAQKFEPFDYQELLYKKNFIRVNLLMVKANLLSRQELLDAFMQSAKEFKLPEADQWTRQWKRIEKVILRLTPDLPGLAEDRRYIDSILQAGSYAVHHSRDYILQYDPHYRILQRDIFLKLISTKPGINLVP